MVFFIAAVIFIGNIISSFLSFDSLIEDYMIIASTDGISTLSIFNSISSSISFRSDAWTIKTRE